MIISSMLVFGSIGVFRRYIPASSAFLACTRGLIGGLFILAFLRLKGSLAYSYEALLGCAVFLHVKVRVSMRN